MRAPGAAAAAAAAGRRRARRHAVLLAAALAVTLAAAAALVLDPAAAWAAAGRRAAPPRRGVARRAAEARPGPAGGAPEPAQPTDGAAMRLDGDPEKRPLPARYNSKLRALVLSSEEYTKSIEMLKKLQDNNLLDDFLEKCVVWWNEQNMYDMKKKEEAKPGESVRVLRNAWPSIWPDSMERERLQAFSAFSALYRKLDSSRLIDIIFEECVPILISGINTEGLQEVQLASTLNPDERQSRMLQRFKRSYICRQYADWMGKDENLGSVPLALSGQMVPFFAKVLSELEFKAATQEKGLDLPPWADVIVVSAVIIGSILSVKLGDVRTLDPMVKLPSFDAAPQVASAVTKRTRGEAPPEWWKMSSEDLEAFKATAPPLEKGTLSYEEKLRQYNEKNDEVSELTRQGKALNQLTAPMPIAGPVQLTPPAAPAASPFALDAPKR